MLSNPFAFLSRTNPTLAIVQSCPARKERAAKWLRYYSDQQSRETFALIAKRWSDPSAFRIFQLNIVKKIVNRRANIYRLSPRRTFTGLDQVIGEALYKSANADIVLKRASRLTKLLKTTALQVGYDFDHPTLHIVTPNILDVVAADPMNPTEIIVTHSANKVEDVSYSRWTAGSYSRLDYRGGPMSIPGNPSGVNPYGILPFVPLFDTLPDDCFFLPGGEDLIEAQEALNVGLTSLWRSIELQSFGQPWATGLAAGDAISVGPERAITLPENGKFGFASVPNSPISDALQALAFLMREVADTNDLNADVFDLDPRSAQSGAAKQVDQIARTMCGYCWASGASDGQEQTSQAQCSDVAEIIFTAGSERFAGSRVLSWRGYQCRRVPAVALGAEGVDRHHENGESGWHCRGGVVHRHRWPGSQCAAVVVRLDLGAGVVLSIARG